MNRSVGRGFFSFIICCCIFVLYPTEAPIEFREFFGSVQPLYAISVTRETIDDADYPKLMPGERELVFQALLCILGQANNLSQLLDAHIARDEEFLKRTELEFRECYSEINQHDIEILNTFSPEILAKYLEEQAREKASKREFFFWSTELGIKYIEEHAQFNLQNVTLQNVNEFIQHNEQEIYALLGQQGKPLIPFMDTKSVALKKDAFGHYMFAKQLLQSLSQKAISEFFCDRADTELQKRRAGVNLKHFFDLRAKVAKNRSFFDIRRQEKDQLLRFIEARISRQVKDNYCLVLFNEMFFGKTHESVTERYAPLSGEEFSEISDQIRALSKALPLAVFYVNFLSYDMDILGRDYKQLILEKSQQWPKKPGERQQTLFFDESSISLAALIGKIRDEQTYHTFKNESLVYCDGDIISSYRKVSYKDEGNALLHLAFQNDPKGALYLFGDGRDTSHKNTNINDYVSTEICYDLEIGVRYRLGNYSPQGKIHLFLSNTLPLSLTDSNREAQMRFNHLPIHIPLIFHIDPHEQDLFINPPMMNFFLNEDHPRETTHDIFKLNRQRNLRAFDPFTIPIRFGIGGNVFTFKIWDLRAAFQQIERYSTPF